MNKDRKARATKAAAELSALADRSVAQLAAKIREETIRLATLHKIDAHEIIEAIEERDAHIARAKIHLSKKREPIQ